MASILNVNKTIHYASHSANNTNRRNRGPVIIVSFKSDKQKSGIHDPAAPAAPWGKGQKRARKEKMAQEQGYSKNAQFMANEQDRSDAKFQHHSLAHIDIDKSKVVINEVEAINEEKADEEYAHMSQLQKWIMETKNVLYSWLKTGIEPL